MASLSVPEAVKRASKYSHCVLSFVGPDGYPLSVASEFIADPSSKLVELGPLSSEVLPAEGQEVNVTFSHIRRVEGVGYDQRRYVSMWGRASVSGRGMKFVVDDTSGWDENETPFFEYCERGVPQGHDYFREARQRPRLGSGWLFLLATRLPFLTATIVPVALGGAVAANHGSFRWSLFGLILFGASAVHLATNIINDVFDDLSGADAANVTPTPFSGGSRVIQYRLVSRRSMVAMAVLFYLIGITVGIYLSESRGRLLYLFGMAGIFVSLAYTAPPLRLVNRGWGEPAVGLGFGPLMAVGTYFVLTQNLSFEVLYASLPVAILIALVLYLNEVPDRAADSAAGKRTLIVRWTRETAVRAYGFATILTYGLLIIGAIGSILPPWTLLGLATVPMAKGVYRDLKAHYEKPYELMPAMQRNIGLHLFTGLLIIAGYLLSLVL